MFGYYLTFCLAAFAVADDEKYSGEPEILLKDLQNIVFPYNYYLTPDLYEGIRQNFLDLN